jgi:transposase
LPLRWRPFANESGSSLRGPRSIRGGRGSVRAVLYMASLSAKRFNPLIRRFAQRLEAAGKSTKVVITACVRKLLVVLNHLLKTKQTWEPHASQTSQETVDKQHSRRPRFS